MNSTLLNPILLFLKRPSTVLTAHLLLRAYQLEESIFHSDESANIIFVRTIVLIIYCLFSYLAWRENKVFLWIMTLILFFSGIVGLIMGAFIVSNSQYILKLLLIIISSYFIFGGAILIPVKKKRKSVGKEISTRA